MAIYFLKICDHKRVVHVHTCAFIDLFKIYFGSAYLSYPLKYRVRPKKTKLGSNDRPFTISRCLELFPCFHGGDQ